MAVSITSQTSPYVDKLIVDTETDNTANTAVFSGAAATMYIYDIDNSDNVSAAVGKFYDNANPTVGGNSSPTEPDIILTVPKLVRQTVTVHDGITFGSDFSFACTVGADTANAVPPTNKVTFRIMAE